ncbi:hypothetical protein [Metabacillus niabensis]|uniref:hypothetical protein n=1 Tax=Metabacillus niabensis TaxID=324854 RepID=UPI001CFC0CBD|nr:hypothetical protein [Metabacillus niabensis]
MKDDDKIKSFSEYQLKKQLKADQHYLLELTEEIDLKHNHHEISESEKQRIQTTVDNVSQLCGWVLSDHVVMRNGIKLVFDHEKYLEKKELIIHTDEQNRLVVTEHKEELN